MRLPGAAKSTMNRVRSILLALAAVPAIILVIVRPDQFYVERVDFVGNHHATNAELRHLSDLRNGTSLWGADLAAVSAGVQRHPWVQSVEVERRLPNRIVVTVHEHEPVALLAFTDGLYYVDQEGTPFLRATSEDLDHPLITGVDATLEKSHPALPRLAIRDALWILTELDSHQVIPLSQVSEIRFERTRGWTIQTSGGTAKHPTAEVLFGFGDYDQQIARLAALIGRGVDLTQPLHVDVAPERVAIVRPLGAPDAPVLAVDPLLAQAEALAAPVDDAAVDANASHVDPSAPVDPPPSAPHP